MLVAITNNHPTTNIVDETKIRSKDNLGDRKLGTWLPFPIDKQTNEIVGDNKKGQLPKPENQSIERNSATSNTSTKDISDKTKKQVKGKKGKVSRQL